MTGPPPSSRPGPGSSSGSRGGRDGFVSGRALSPSCLPAPPRRPEVHVWRSTPGAGGLRLSSSALTPAFNTPTPCSPITSPRHLHVETLAGSSGSPVCRGLLSWAPHPIPHWPHPHCWVALVPLVLSHPRGSSFEMCHSATAPPHPRSGPPASLTWLRAEPFNMSPDGSPSSCPHPLQSVSSGVGGGGTSHATIPGCLGWKAAWPLAAPAHVWWAPWAPVASHSLTVAGQVNRPLWRRSLMAEASFTMSPSATGSGNNAGLRHATVSGSC